MKLRIPLSLRKCLLTVMTAVLAVTCGTANGGVMHPDITYQTYTDYAQNLGRYVQGSKVNSLLQYIREEVDKGIIIHYTDGTTPFVISNAQGIVDSSGVDDIGAQNAVSPTFAATVLHNGSIDASYGARVVGDEHAINYASIDIRSSDVFRLAPYVSNTTEQYDYMLQRQSKLQTDAVWIPVTTVEDLQSYVGCYVYHIGAGSKGVWDTETNSEISLADAYSYIIGGINDIISMPVHDAAGNFSLNQNPQYANGIGANLDNPLPNVIRAGDSGSPTYIYNTETGQYEYIAAQQSGAGTYGQARGNIKWSHETLESFNARVDMSEDSVVYLDAVLVVKESHTDNLGNTALEYLGYVTDADGNILTEYSALSSGVNAWNDLSGLKDTQNWYAYDANAYLGCTKPELFFNQNLVFTPTQAENTIVLNDTVDLGVGYVEFNKGETDKAIFTIVSESGESNLLNSAGYVINEGAEVHISFTNPEDHMYEWRKVGKGDLYIEGQGDSNALLNVGGEGTTYLQRQGGHAAYNVLINTGATVVIADLEQIERDLTFGSGGGTLNMNGNSLDWYQTTDAEGRFTINALTEQALITNTRGETVLTFLEGGECQYKGSFSDSENGSLRVDYQGGGTWVLNSIHTDLSHHEDSGFVVSNGHVTLTGTLTVHGMGSLDATNTQRLVKENDWHYADAAMNVEIRNGASFELGSHARLTGDVTVAEGASFVVREGVKDRYEYVEGGALLEDTYRYAAFYGLHGDVYLDGEMRVEYSEGTTANTTYSGSISGDGVLIVDLGISGGTYTLTGDNSSFAGEKRILTGGVIAEDLAALGNVELNKWLIDEDGYIASDAFTSADAALPYIDTASKGIWALTESYDGGLVDLSAHGDLTIGALTGNVVQYGSASEKLEVLKDSDGKAYWSLGGGGGELVVNALLEGEADLYLGSAESSQGIVTLTNTGNSFVGDIIFRGQGMVLNAVEGAMGQSSISLLYGNAFSASYSGVIAHVKSASDGMLLIDNIKQDDISLINHGQIAIASGQDAVYTGHLELADGAVYRFNALQDATLRIQSELDATRDIVIDAQGIIGGQVVLESLTSVSSDLTIQGGREGTEPGSIGLLLHADFSTQGVLNLEDGGYIDVAGNTLFVNGIFNANGAVIDSATGGELVLNMSAENSEVASALYVDTIRKTNSGAMTLSGEGSFVHLYIDAGTLTLGRTDISTEENTIHLADGTTLNVGTYHLNSHISMDAAQTEASLTRTGSAATLIAGNISLASGARLHFAADSTYTLKGAQYGGAGAYLSFNGGTVNLTSQSAISIAGTVEVQNQMTLFSRGSANDMVRNIEQINIAGGQLTIREESWNTIWNIGSLSGQGNVYWHSDTTHSTTSRLCLGGDGGFEGTITLNRQYSSDTRTHGAFIEIVSDTAARNAAIHLSGAGASSVASVAINTDNAHIKGLSGNEYSYVYAGASMADSSLSGENRPPTTRSASLTINTAADTSYNYAGALGNSADTLTRGLSVVKSGAGTQSFSGSSLFINNVQVSGGVLAMPAAEVRGRIALAYGSTLQLNQYTLGTEQVLRVWGEDGSTAAVFDGNLTLAGGILAFDAGSLVLAQETQNALLQISGGLQYAESVTTQVIQITHASSLCAGQSYKLATGVDWSEFVNTLTCVGVDFYNTSFSIDEDGSLVLNVSLKDNAIVWTGTDSAHSWTATMFGSDAQDFTADSDVMFDSSAQNTIVSVEENVTVGNAYFLSDADYTVESENGSIATVGALSQQGLGDTYLVSGIMVNGATVVDAGRLVLKSTGLLGGAVSGEGTLVIDWGQDSSGTLQLGNLNTLHIASGSYGSKSSGVLSVQNIIVDAAARYIQGDNVTQKAGVISNGGVLELAGGGLNGTLELMGDTELYIRSGDVNLDSSLTQNGYTLTQTFSGTGTGVMHIDADSKAVLDNYIVSQGTLRFDGTRLHTGHGTITVKDGAVLDVGIHAGLEAEQIILESGAKLLLKNGNGGSYYHVTSDIQVSDGAIISGSLYGNASRIQGTISGSGTLYFKTTGTEGSNVYTVYSQIKDAADAAALALCFDNSQVILAGDNSYSGGTSILSGSVTANHEHALGNGCVTINDGALSIGVDMSIAQLLGTGGELNLNAVELQAQNISYSGAVSGTGSLVTMAPGANLAFTGDVHLNSLFVTYGEVSLTGSSNIAAIMVDSGATLTLGGTIALSESVNNFGTVRITDDILFDLDAAKLTSGVVELISGSGSIEYGSSALSISNFAINGLALSDELQLVVDAQDQYLQVTLSGLVRYREWTGAESAIWDSVTKNWQDSDGLAAKYLVCDRVEFGAAATQQQVTLDGNQRVTSMSVSGGEYSFSGGNLSITDTLTIAEGASVQFADSMVVSLSGVLTLAGDLALTVPSSTTMLVEANGGSFTKNGSGTLTWYSETEPIKLDSLTVSQGVFEAESALQCAVVTLTANSELQLNHQDGSSQLASVSGGGAVSVLNSGDFSLGDAVLSTLTLKGNSDVVITGAVSADKVSLGKTRVELAEGAQVTTSRYTSGNTASGQVSQVAISQGAVLTVTGSNQKDATDSDMLLAHWGASASLLHLNGGELNVLNTFVLMGWDAGGTLQVSSGVANLYGIRFSSQRGNADSFILDAASAGEAIVNLGAYGITNIGSNDTVSLGCGTIKATADWAATGQGSVSLVSTGAGTVLDTNGYTVTFEAGLDGNGILLKQGDGTLVMAGNTTDFTGMIDVQQGFLLVNSVPGHVHLSAGGSLEFGDAVALDAGMHLTGSGGVVADNLVLNGGSIGVDAAWLNAVTAAITVENTYTVSFADGVSSQLVKISDFENIQTGNYYLINGSFAEGITGDMFTLGEMGAFVEASFTVNETGLWLTLAAINGGVQIWNGTDAAHQWSDSVFGASENKNLATMLFNDEAQNRNVVVAADVMAEKMLFANTYDYSITASNLSNKITVQTLEMTGVGSVRIASALSAEEYILSAGSLSLVGAAQQDHIAKLTLTNGASLNIGASSLTVDALAMESGTTISDIGGTGALTLTQALDSGGTLNVGTVNVQDSATFVAGAALHTLNVLGSTAIVTDLAAKEVSLAAGSSLTVTNGYTLAESASLRITGSGGAFNGDLILAGGSVCVDLSALDSELPLLTVNGNVSQSEGISTSVCINNIGNTTAGGSYVLMSGLGQDQEFTFILDSAALRYSELNYSEGQVELTLFATNVWNGSEAANEWSADVFGPQEGLSQDTIAVFNDTAESKMVQLTNDVTVRSLYFVNTSEYNIGSESSNTLTADTLWVAGSGAVNVNTNMAVTTAVELAAGASLVSSAAIQLDSSGSLLMGENASWRLAAGAEQSLTEAQLKSIGTGGGSLVVEQGATLTLTDKATAENNTSNAFAQVSGAGNVVLLLAYDNGVGFDLSTITGDITVAYGRLQINTSEFCAESAIHLSATDGSAGQLVFNDSGTVFNNNVVLESDTGFHVNNGKSAVMGGVISGDYDLTKYGAGTLTFTTQNIYNGDTVINGGKIVLDTAGDYILYGNVSSGTLEVAAGTTLVNNGKNVSSALVLNTGANARFDQLMGSSSITVNEGAQLTYGSADTKIAGFNKAVHTGGGRITIYLSDAYGNALKIGSDFTGETYLQSGWFQINDSTFGSTLYLADGVNFQLSGGSSVTLDKDLVLAGATQVHQNSDATFTVNGTVSGDGEYVRKGGGTLTFNNNVNLRAFTQGVDAKTIFAKSVILESLTQTSGTIDVYSGTAEVTGTLKSSGGSLSITGGELLLSGSENTHSVANLDTSVEGTSTGVLRVGEGVQLKVTTALKSCDGSSVVLEKGASLAVTHATFSNKNEGEATLKSTAAGGSTYSLASTDFKLENGHFIFNATSQATVKNLFENSTIQNDCQYYLHVDNAENVLTGIIAAGGDVVALNKDEHSLQELKIATGLTVGAYKGSTLTAADEAVIKVTQLAQFGQGATLNADLVLESGATVQMDGTLTMGSDLTLETGLTLSGDKLAAVENMSADGVSKVELFTGIDKLILGTTEYTTSITAADHILASLYFSNVSSDYLLVYDASVAGEGVLSIMVPEPSTATLSLLALAALAARRRRRQ